MATQRALETLKEIRACKRLIENLGEELVTVRGEIDSLTRRVEALERTGLPPAPPLDDVGPLPPPEPAPDRPAVARKP